MFSAFARAGCACFLVLAAVAAASARAADSAEPVGELSLATAVEAALRRNPDLAASAYELSAAQARLTQAALRMNPEVGLELENFAGTGAVRATDALETTLSLSQVVELGDKRELRISAAQAALDTTSIEQRARELDVLAEVTRRFIDVVAAQERASVAADATTLAEASLNSIGARVEAARSPEAERSRAQIAATRARIEQRQAASELQAARVALSAAWGSVEPRFSVARAELLDLPPVLAFDALAQRIERSADVERLASDSRMLEAELRLARAQARPNLAFSLGVRRFEEGGDAALVAGFSVSLPVADRNQGGIREAQARLSQSEALRSAAMLRVRAVLFALHQELTATHERVTGLRHDALPQAQLALDQTRSGYERGRFSFLELATAQEELLAIRAAIVDAAADYHRLLAEMERLTGSSVAQRNR